MNVFSFHYLIGGLFYVHLIGTSLIVCIGVSTPLKSTTLLFLVKPPPLNLQTVQAPFLDDPLLYISFS